MLGIHVRSHAALLLRFGNNLQRQGRLTRRFRTVYLDYAAARYAADTESDIEPKRAGRDHRNIFCHTSLAELHDRAFAELLFDLAYR